MKNNKEWDMSNPLWKKMEERTRAREWKRKEKEKARALNKKIFPKGKILSGSLDVGEYYTGYSGGKN